MNIIAHMVHSPPIHNDCFMNKDFIIIMLHNAHRLYMFERNARRLYIFHNARKLYMFCYVHRLYVSQRS